MSQIKDKWATQKTIKLTDPDSGKLCGEVQIEISFTDVQTANAKREEWIYEYQRWAGEWGDPQASLDPGKFSSKDGSVFKDSFAELEEKHPSDWEVLQDWAMTVTKVMILPS